MHVKLLTIYKSNFIIVNSISVFITFFSVKNIQRNDSFNFFQKVKYYRFFYLFIFYVPTSRSCY